MPVLNLMYAVTLYRYLTRKVKTGPEIFEEVYASVLASFGPTDVRLPNLVFPPDPSMESSTDSMQMYNNTENTANHNYGYNQGYKLNSNYSFHGNRSESTELPR